MNTDEIKLFYEYNFWANKRILTACARVSQEQYVVDTRYGNLRATVVHTLSSEISWRTAFQEYFVALDAFKAGAQAEKPALWNIADLTETDLPTLDAVTERWRVEEQEMRAYLGNLLDRDLNGLVRYTIPGGFARERPLWHCLLHLVNHGTQHRSEAAALLTSYDQSPGDLDFTVFLNAYFNLPS